MTTISAATKHFSSISRTFFLGPHCDYRGIRMCNLRNVFQFHTLCLEAKNYLLYCIAAKFDSSNTKLRFYVQFLNNSKFDWQSTANTSRLRSLPVPHWRSYLVSSSLANILMNSTNKPYISKISKLPASSVPKWNSCMSLFLWLDGSLELSLV